MKTYKEFLTESPKWIDKDHYWQRLTKDFEISVIKDTLELTVQPKSDHAWKIFDEDLFKKSLSKFKEGKYSDGAYFTGIAKDKNTINKLLKTIFVRNIQNTN